MNVRLDSLASYSVNDVAQAANLEKPACDIQSQDWKSKIVICLKKGLLPLG